MEVYNFKGKRALVTGAGKGIGRKVAVELAKLGAKVFAIDRIKSGLDTLKEEVQSIEPLLVDIADWYKTREIVESIGAVDLLVNNAAILRPCPFLEVTKEEFENQLDINYKAAFNITQVITRGMASRGSGGAIVNVSSVSSFHKVSTFTVYGTTKAALDRLTQNLANELGSMKIRVNSVNPTFVMTAMTQQHLEQEPGRLQEVCNSIPLGRLAECSEVVDAIIFLLSDKASMVTGALLPVDGGCIIGCMI